jgi:hypothetical protein
MRFLWLAVVFLTTTALLNTYAQEQPAPKTEPAKAEPAPAQGQAAAKPANSGPAVDAAKVTGSTFESQYFKFTYELPQGWKALDDAVRVASNQQVLQQDAERLSTSLPKKTSAKSQLKSSSIPGQHVAPLPERYSLMAASPNGLDSLASPVMPRINMWAHRRVPPLDKAMDHAQLLVAGKHNEVLVRPHELMLDGHTFVRVELITAPGTYQSRYITVIGDYLVGFDFLAQSEREMVEIANTIKSVKFN